MTAAEGIGMRAVMPADDPPIRIPEELFALHPPAPRLGDRPRSVTLPADERRPHLSAYLAPAPRRPRQEHHHDGGDPGRIGHALAAALTASGRRVSPWDRRR